jgi:HSP20 family protein
MNITRWSPREVVPNAFWRFGDVDRIFDDFFRDWAAPRMWSRRHYEEDFFPHVDVKDYEAEYVMVADLPGLARDKLDLNVAADRVTLKGCFGAESESQSELKEESYYCQERYSGCFEREISLPGEIDVDGVKATMSDGVLSIRLPKVQADRVRRIELTEQ